MQTIKLILNCDFNTLPQEIIRKASFHPQSIAACYHDHLFGAMQLPPPYPYAAFAALSIPDAKFSYWLKATPVHIETTHNDAYLTNFYDLALTDAEVLILTKELRQLFNPEQAIFYPLTSQEWLLNLAYLPQIQTQTLHDSHHKSLFPLLPQGLHRNSWHQLFTEVQMLFYNNAINHSRIANQNLSVSGLWFWGEGNLPDNHTLSNTIVITDDQSLLQWCKRLKIICNEIHDFNLIKNYNYILAFNVLTPAVINLLPSLEKTKATIDIYCNDKQLAIKSQKWWHKFYNN